MSTAVTLQKLEIGKPASDISFVKFQCEIPETREIVLLVGEVLITDEMGAQLNDIAAGAGYDITGLP